MSVLETLQDLVGPELSATVADGGLEFERLEWMGDSVLDAIVIRQVVLTANPLVPLGSLLKRHSDLVRDDTLIATAERLGLPFVGHSTPKDQRHRLGDSVEAWIGAGFVAKGWQGAATAASILVMPDVTPETLLAGTSAPRSLGGDLNEKLARAVGHDFADEGWLRLVLSAVPWRRRLVPCGAEVIEAAYAIELFHKHPGEDEGALSRRRAELLRADRVTAVAERAGVRAKGWKGNDRLMLALLGAVSLDAGPEHAVAELSKLLDPAA